MAEYVYKGNLDPNDGTSRIAIGGFDDQGQPKKAAVIGETIELTNAEHDRLSARFVLEPVKSSDK